MSDAPASDARADESPAAEADVGTPDSGGDAPASEVSLGAFGLAHAVTELAGSDGSDLNPTLTADMLELVFTSNRTGGSGDHDIYIAKRASVDAPFDAPIALKDLNTSDFETSAAISLDGLTLWFGSDRPNGKGGVDIYFSTRANRTAPWSAPAPVEELDSEDDQIPRPPGARGLIMPMAIRKKDSSERYQNYFSTRTSPAERWAAPVALPRMTGQDSHEADGFLSDDGLTFCFKSDRDGSQDLFVSIRSSLEGSWSTAKPLTELNTGDDESDPWLSPDGRVLYFASDRGGDSRIYRAER